MNWKKLKTCIKYFSPIKFIMFVLLGFGHYSILSSSKLVSAVFRVYTIAFFAIIHFYTYKFEYSDFTSYTSLELATTVLFSQITAGKYFFKFCNAIQAVDKRLGSRKPLISPLFLCIWFLLSLPRVIDFVVAVHYLINIVGLGWLFVLRNVVPTALMVSTTDLIYLPLLIIFDIMRARMLNLKKAFELNKISVNIVASEKIDKQIEHIRKCRQYYTDLLNMLHNIDIEVQFLVIRFCFIHNIDNLGFEADRHFRKWSSQKILSLSQLDAFAECHHRK